MNGKRIKEVSNTFSRIVNRLGFNKDITDRRQILTFHSLRHTFASWLALNGEDLKSIQELMRHKTISMTMKYAHLIPDKKRKAVRNIIGPLCGLPNTCLKEQGLLSIKDLWCAHHFLVHDEVLLWCEG